MSTVKFWMNLFLSVIFISHTVVTNVDCAPVKKKPLNITHKMTPNTNNVLSKSPWPKKQPNRRDPRFLGKFSFVAGLNLPNPPTMTPIHRNDMSTKEHVPTQYVTTYNFPPLSWGPFAAAVYEPPPILSFFGNPLGYLTAFLNPYNWFNNSFAITDIPTTFTTTVPDKNQDEVFFIMNDSDNEILNEERMNKIESKMSHQEIGKKKYVTKHIPFKVSTTKQYITLYDEESATDLIAEETTVQPIEKVRISNNYEEDSRQLFGKRTTQKTESSTRYTEPSTRYTEHRTRFTEPHTKLTEPHSRATKEEKETNIPKNVTLPTQRPNTTRRSNSTIEVTTSTKNITSQTPYPSNNATYPINNPGYYYGGYPQNVSYIELTTLQTPQIDQPIQSFNNVNNYVRPYQPSYNNLDEPLNKQTFDFSERSEQLPPLPINYYDKSSNFIFNNMEDNKLHGFKPSFPLLF